jgi:hypothetical protein
LFVLVISWPSSSDEEFCDRTVTQPQIRLASYYLNVTCISTSVCPARVCTKTIRYDKSRLRSKITEADTGANRDVLFSYSFELSSEFLGTTSLEYTICDFGSKTLSGRDSDP